MNTAQNPHHRLVAPHKHTGHTIAREHTSYALIAFILLSLGVLLTGLTATVKAIDSGTDPASGSIAVTATVQGSPPPSPAVIISPKDETHFTSIPIDISGICPAGYMVRVFKNSTLAGAVFCSNDGTFGLSMDLFKGANTVEARVYNAGELEGPRSGTRTLYYDPPASSPLVTNPTIEQLSLDSQNYYKGYYPGDTINWKVDINGGQAPYALNVDWGDGTSQLISRDQAGEVLLQHAYSKGGGYHGSYIIKIRVSDFLGQTAYLQLTTIVNSLVSGNVITPSQNITTNQTLSLIRRQLSVSWPLYGVTVSMAASFWLGERRARSALVKRVLRTARGAH